MDELANTIMRALKLPPLLATALAKLHQQSVVAPNEIHDGAEGRAIVFRLRKELEAYNITVHSRRGIGYYLDKEDKVRLAEIVSQA